MKQQGYNPYVTAQTQFDNVANILDLDQSVRELLRQPSREFHFTIPVKMDDGTTKYSMATECSTMLPRGPAKVEFAFIRWKQSIRSEHYPCG